jgi:V/A-type H+-transporting ATPase subunit F
VAFYIIGGEELVIGFRFVGVPGMVAETADEAREAFRAATALPGVMVLIISEQVSAMIPREVMDWQMSGAYPLLVEIPGIAGHMEGRAGLTDAIREAVGLHV